MGGPASGGPGVQRQAAAGGAEAVGQTQTQGAIETTANKARKAAKEFTDLFAEPKGPIVEEAKEAVRGRFVESKVGQFRARRYYRAVRKRFSESERSDMTFYRERTGNPFRKGDSFGALKARLSDKAKRFVDHNFDRRTERLRQVVNKSGFGGDVAFIENYIAHFWTGAGKAKKIKTLAQSMVRRNPFANRRTYATFEDGMRKAGLKPLTTDIAALGEMREAIANQVVANNRMLHWLRKLKTPEGRSVILPEARAPKDWIRSDHPALRRVFATRNAQGETILFKGSVKMHPDAWYAAKMVFDQPIGLAGVRAMEGFNALAKAIELGASGFHHVALTESALFSGLYRPVKAARTGLKRMRDPGNVREMVEAGLGLGPISDVQVTRIERMLLNVESRARNIPIAGRAVKGLRKGKKVWDRVLWDYYHTGVKVEAYSRKVAAELVNPKNARLSIKQIRRDVAQHVNDAFGGQNWETMWRIHPKVRQVAHWSLLAPDWTLSNLRIAGKGFGGGIQGRLARRYWVRAFPVLLGGHAILNRVLSGHWIGDNDPGHEWDIELPFKDDQDRKLYVHAGKQAREVLRWFENPFRTLGSKLSPFAREIGEQMFSHQAGSTFPTEFARQAEEGAGFWETVPSRIKNVAGKFWPYAFSDSQFAFALPMSRGMTYYKNFKALVKAIEKGDEARIKRLKRAAAENNLDAEKLYKHANSEVRGRHYRDFWRAFEGQQFGKMNQAAARLKELGVKPQQFIQSGERRGVERPQQALRTFREAS